MKSFIIILTIVYISYASSYIRAEEIPNIYLSPRSESMGGAFTAIANDETAMWTNTAGIARVRKARSRSSFHFSKVPNLILGSNTESSNFYNSIKANQADSVEDILSNKKENSSPFWARATIFPVMLFDVDKNSPMALGILSNTVVKAKTDSEDSNSVSINAISDQAVFLTYALTSRDNRINLGIQLRPTIRFAYEDQISAATLINKKDLTVAAKSKANKTQGLGADIGFMYTAADYWFPTFGVAVLNLPTGCQKNFLNPFSKKRGTVCGTKFSGSILNEDALSVIDPMDLRVGVSITPRITRELSFRMAVDVHHIAVQTGTSTYGLTGIEANKLVHAGIEVFVGNPLLISPFSVRAGYAQGFLSYGASLNTKYFAFDLAVYGRDISSTVTPEQDKRILASLSLGF